MPIQSKNPATDEVLETFDELSDEQIEEKLVTADETFKSWRQTSFAERAEKMKKLGEILRERAADYGRLASLEMGKPITQATAEVEKCAGLCDFYAEQAEAFLAPEIVKTENSESYVRFDPIGAVLAVMPWNYPFWQVFRFAVPAAMAGNVGLLKHASNVPQCALAIEEAFRDAGFSAGVFQTLLIGARKVEPILRDKRVRAATLTGSEPAGASVASICGQEIKKTVMELGGSDPFIVRADADLDVVLPNAVTGRLQNAGQSCICAKRFIVHSSLYEDFIARLKEAFEKTKVGDQIDPTTEMGPIVDAKSRTELLGLVHDTVAAGGRLVTGGEVIGEMGCFMQPTIVADVAPGMRLWLEETFGPVATVISFDTDDEAIEIANATDFGLGGSIHTADIETAKSMAARIDSGAIFINRFTASDQRMPFGGVKRSGYGRELSRDGIREFVNVKTVVVK